MITCGAAINLKLLCGNCHIVCSDQLGVQTCCLIPAEFHVVSLDFAVKPANMLPVHSVVAASSLPPFFASLQSAPRTSEDVGRHVAVESSFGPHLAPSLPSEQLCM